MMLWLQPNTNGKDVLEMLPGQHMDVQDLKSKHGLSNSPLEFGRKRVVKLLRMGKVSAEFLTSIKEQLVGE